MSELSDLVKVLSDFLSQVKSITPINQILRNQNLRFESFNEDVESFDSYSQRLNNYFKLKGLTEISAETERAKSFSSNSLSGTKTFQIIVKFNCAR